MPISSSESNDPTLANQTAQGATLTAISDRLGEAISAPAANTLNHRLSTLLTRFGESIAAPAANTLLGRLQLILDLITGTGTASRLRVDASLKLQTTATCTRSTPTVGTTAVVVMLANAERRGAVMFNRGTGTVYLSYVATVSATAYRHVLAPNQGVQLFTLDEPYTGAWNAVSTVANNAMEVFHLT